MKMKILVVSDPDREKKGLSEWVNRNRNYDLNFVNSDEKAIEVCNRQDIHLVLVDGLNLSIDYKKIVGGCTHSAAVCYDNKLFRGIGLETGG